MTFLFSPRRASDAEWLKEAAKLPPDEPFKCSHCGFTCGGLDALRMHLNYAHLNYRPFRCLACDKRLPCPDMPMFEKHCRAQGHPRPYKVLAEERYNMRLEALLHKETGRHVRAKMATKDDKEGGFFSDLCGTIKNFFGGE